MTSSQHTESAQTASSSSSGIPLPRGTACLPCRRRKMRCDGAKPACGQCVGKRRQEDCEYTSDIQGLTKIQMLEENIALLESRIKELENPECSQAIKLSAIGSESRSSTSPSNSSIHLAPTTIQNTNSAHGAPDTKGLVSLHAPSVAHGSSASSLPAYSAPAASNRGPSIQEIRAMVNTFIPNVPQVGFFLHIARFMQLFYVPIGSRDPLFEALVTTVCLWGARLSNNPELAFYEPPLLARAVQQLSGSLFVRSATLQDQNILYTIQAEVLLATYFFTQGRFLEGKYHSSAAVSLVTSFGLNTVGSSSPIEAGMNEYLGPYVPLTQALVLRADPTPDAVCNGEKVNAFWTVYILDKTWAVALNSPSSISDSSPLGMQITTPWPLTLDAYGLGERPVPDPQGNPIVGFLSGTVSPDVNNTSPLCLRAKAAVLFSRASSLASRYREDAPELNGLCREFQSLDGLITSFINSLPPLPVISKECSELLVAHTLARVAIIQLHVRFTESHTQSRDICFTSANAVLASLRDASASGLGYLDPIMAILLSTAGQVILDEIARLGLRPSSEEEREYLMTLNACIDRLVTTMTDFSTVIPLMASQALQIEHARAVVL